MSLYDTLHVLSSESSPLKKCFDSLLSRSSLKGIINRSSFKLAGWASWVLYHNKQPRCVSAYSLIACTKKYPAQFRTNSKVWLEIHILNSFPGWTMDIRIWNIFKQFPAIFYRVKKPWQVFLRSSQIRHVTKSVVCSMCGDCKCQIIIGSLL